MAAGAMIEIQTDSVRSFMRAILPTEAHYAGPPVVFRGQADNRWSIVPSLWRAKSWDPLGGAAQHRLRVVGDLVEDGADSVTAVGQSLLYTLGRVLHRHGLPPAVVAGPSLEAFAQHIGLPTRMLDWTRSPLYAAYFAASDVARLNLSGDRFVIYSMSALYLENSNQLESLEKPDVGGWGNPNLVAQEGRFICIDKAPADLLAGVTRSIVTAGEPLGRIACAAVDNHFAAVTLGHEHAPKLLRTLRDQGIHAATMFPGNGGVAELVREVIRSP